MQVEKETEDPFTTRSMTEAYARNLCIICQTLLDGQLTKAMYTKTGVKMLTVAQKIPCNLFFCRFNSITNVHDPVANDVIYYDVCKTGS